MIQGACMRIRFAAVMAATTAAAILTVACYDRKNPTAPSGDDSVEMVGEQAALRLQSVTVSPPADTIGVGQTVQLTATANPPTPGVVFVWKSSRTSTATVDQNGLVTGVSVGRVTITAKAGGKTGKSTITVTAAPPPPPPPPPPPGSEIFVGAGDIAGCSSSGDEATANLLDNIAGTVYTLGDNVYNSGTTTEYNDCYGPSWGRHKARTRPSIGNHDYVTLSGGPYYTYFGSNAGEAGKGYYSYDLGVWHIIVLNSNIAVSAGSVQEQWLRADLAAHSNSCTLAYWHHPRFSSGSEHGNNASMQPLWQALYDANADLILGGHDHDYERFAPQTPAGLADNTRGIREFVVGTGGISHYALGTLKANSQVFNSDSFGVLKLTLYEGGYDWQFVPVAGATFTDAGSGSCH
jgi:hypothetical protein